MSRKSMIFGILILLLMVGVSGCTSATPYPSTATITAVRLGPTSTSEPIPPSPTPPPPTETLRPIDPITTNDWSRGPQDAPITFLIYSDFQCPYCRALEDVLSQLEVLHEDEIQVVFRHFPLLSIHDKASLAGQAAEAAGEQGQFWEMHDFLFQNQPEWTLLSPDAFVEYLIRAGSEFELDNVKFAEDIETEKWRPVMEASYLQGLQSGLTGTPFIFMNGTWLQLEPNLENLASLVRLSLLDERRFDSPPEILIDLDQTYYAILQLPEGNVVMELFSRIAPHNVNNFVFLAEQGWFDHNPIYRVTRTAIVETGDPSGTGYGNPGYLLKDEISSALEFDQAGMVAMSNTGPDTNGSQFFITLEPLPALNGSHTIIGQVIEGLELLEALEPVDPDTSLFSESTTTVESVTIEVQ